MSMKTVSWFLSLYLFGELPIFAINRWMVRVLVVSLLTVGASASGQVEHKVRVGVAGNEPFVMRSGGDYQGIAIDIWEKIARESGLTFDYHAYDSVSEALDQLEAGDIDAVVGPVTITADRQEKFIFTQPYFNSSLGIMSRNNGQTLWGIIKPFFTMTFFIALGVFLMILSVVGFLVWIAERRTPGGPFSKRPVMGIGNGIWLALVTMTTVGYGDLSPRTLLGRIILGAWMVIALLSATSLLAGLAGTIALSGKNQVSIKLASDLAGRKVSAIKDSPGADFVRRFKGRPINAENLKDALKQLREKQVDALVFDRPQLRYFLAQTAENKLSLSTEKYQQQGYGFAFQKISPYAEVLNINLLRLQEAGFLNEVEMKWLPESKD